MIIDRRYDFTIFIDVQNGNPNVDPDSNNMPRIDPETGLGIITDVCIKRKIRNYVDMVKAGSPGYRIYIKQGTILNDSDGEALESVGLKNSNDKKIQETKKKDPSIDLKIRDYMCSNFYDIRTFGAVMTTFVKGALNCGQIRGPVQLCFAQSIDPIMSRDITLTRVALTTEKEADSKRNTMGRKAIVPYALYRLDGYVSANLANITGFSDDDLKLLWEAIINMFEDDHSAARGKMNTRKLFVFEHKSKYGNAPSWQLFDSIKAVKIDDNIVPRSFSDYVIKIDKSLLPKEVNCIEML